MVVISFFVARNAHRIYFTQHVESFAEVPVGRASSIGRAGK
jgi:hypothetical protein